MTAANLDVRPAVAPGIVAPNATNLVLLFALEAMPVSAQRPSRVGPSHWGQSSARAARAVSNTAARVERDMGPPSRDVTCGDTARAETSYAAPTAQ